MDNRNCRGPFIAQAGLILASSSPRRKKFLEELGLDCEALTASVEEQPRKNEAPQAFVLRAATEKAGAISHLHPETWVLGADTVVVYQNEILGKPVNKEDALRILTLLAGNQHEVLTGFCLCRQKDSRIVTRVVTTEVRFAPFTETIAAAYIHTGEPFDKAGGYGIQGMGGFLVETINGSYSNVVGLPLAELIEELLRHEVIAPRLTH